MRIITRATISHADHTIYSGCCQYEHHSHLSAARTAARTLSQVVMHFSPGAAPITAAVAAARRSARSARRSSRFWKVSRGCRFFTTDSWYVNDRNLDEPHLTVDHRKHRLKLKLLRVAQQDRRRRPYLDLANDMMLVEAECQRHIKIRPIAHRSCSRCRSSSCISCLSGIPPSSKTIPRPLYGLPGFSALNPMTLRRSTAEIHSIRSGWDMST